MRIKKLVKSAVSFTAGSLLGLMLFVPWGGAASLMSAVVSCEAAAKGIKLEITEASAEGIFSPRFKFNGIKADMAPVSLNISQIEVRPHIVKTLANRDLYASVFAGSGKIDGRPVGTIVWRSAKAESVVTEDTVVLKNIKTDGDIKAEGYMELSKDGRIIKSDMAVTVPQKFDSIIKAVSIIGSLPLKNSAPGEWRIKK